MQPRFTLTSAAGALLLFALAMAGAQLIGARPDRVPAPPALASATLEKVALDSSSLAPLRLRGAWRVRSDEPRFGGVSALALEGGDLVALTDRGAVIRLQRRIGGRLRLAIAELPDGPGDPRWRKDRDSEALARDPAGRWWVAFENHHQLWSYDRKFTRAVAVRAVPATNLGANTGVEGLAFEHGRLLAFAESGGRLFRSSGSGWAEERLDRPAAVVDAASIDGGALLLERTIGPAGFDNALALVRREGGQLRTLWRRRLPVAWRDNVEGLAAEPLPGGGYRLWLMSDDNFHPRLRTMLLVVDVPAAALPKSP